MNNSQYRGIIGDSFFNEVFVPLSHCIHRGGDFSENGTIRKANNAAVGMEILRRAGAACGQVMAL